MVAPPPEISMKRRLFLYPIQPIQRKNKEYSSLRRNNEPFWELKMSKMEDDANISKNGFLYRSWIFIALPKLYATH
jgi:hypothetical protein